MSRPVHTITITNASTIASTITIAIAIVLATACGPTLPPVTPNGPDMCPAACERLRAMKCPAGEPTPAGQTCETWCDATERTGYTTMHPGCVAASRSCEEADRVSAEGCGP